MVATIQVLSGSASGIAKYFTGAATTQYYAAERPGLWWGDTVISLSLPAHVTKHDFQHVLLGLAPSGKRLVRDRTRKEVSPNRPRGKRHHAEGSTHVDEPPTSQNGSGPSEKVAELKPSGRCPGYDLTFSAPKSVSVLWAVGDGQMRRDIEEAMIASVRETLTTLRETVPLARRGRGGSEQQFAEWNAAMFLHTVSRELEPQLHVHSVIPNLCQTPDGRWSAINSRALHNWTPALGRVFRCQLAAELSRRLGVTLYRPDRADGTPEQWFEVSGVPQELAERWSSRRQAIESEVDERGELIDISSAKARERANLATRKEKPARPDMGAVAASWRQQAQQYGFDESAAKQLTGHRPETVVGDPYPEALRAALQKISLHDAHFTARDVVRQVTEDLQHLGLPARSLVRRVLRDLEQSPAVVPLQVSGSERRYATQETWQREADLLAAVRAMKDQPGARLSSQRAEKAIRRDTALSAEQRAAAKYLLSDPGSIRVLCGVAGAGKSRTLDVVRQGFERGGYRVLGGALAGAAKEELVRQAHIDSRTVASYLYHLEKSNVEKIRDRLIHDAKQLLRALVKKPTYAPTRVALDRKTVLILDEAAMLDTHTLNRLIHQVRQANATLILAGDWKQLPPILAGAPMERIAKEVGATTLQENRRQVDPADRQAVESLRKGDVAKAIEQYAARDRVTVGSGLRDTVDKLAAAWADNGGCRRPADHMVFTQTRAEARAVNRLCQQHLLQSLGAVPLLSVTHGQEKYHIGDRVLFHQAFRAKGIENGYRATVVAVDPILRRLTVKLDHEPSAAAKAQGKTRFVRVPLRKLPPEAISLGYAATTHKMQGQTVQHAYLLMSGDMMSREMAYVQATRAKQTTRIFVDQLHAGPELKDLIKAVERSKAKNLAHDLAPPPPPSRSISPTLRMER